MRDVTSPLLIVYLWHSISTHTPHARRDTVNGLFSGRIRFISTHTPHARRDSARVSDRTSETRFQLPHARRDGMATRNMNGNRISTHTPHARRDEMTVDTLRILDISTHTPHARRDAAQNRIIAQSFAFQLTRLMRGVTAVVVNCQRDCAFQLTRLMRGVT